MFLVPFHVPLALIDVPLSSQWYIGLYHIEFSQWYIMAKKITPLTNTQVKQAKALDKEYTLTDGNGLQLKIKLTSSKTWLFKYSKSIAKKRFNIGFGSYPEISIAQAREKRKHARVFLAQNMNPKA